MPVLRFCRRGTLKKEITLKDWFITLIVSQLTPEIKKLIIAFIKDLDKKAKDTPNIYDDMIVNFFKSVMSIE